MIKKKLILACILFTKISGFSQAPAMPGVISGSATAFCPTDVANFSIDTVAGATSYTWATPSGVTINSGQGTTSINVIFQNNTCWAGNNITVTASNGFGTSAAQTLTLASNGNIVFNNYNIDPVSNGGISPSFTIASPSFISKITNYHWNGGAGATPGTIGLLNTTTSVTYGPWTAVAGSGCGGVQIDWTVFPSTTIPAGTYQIIDSDPATWSYNALSGGYGFSQVDSCMSQPLQPLPCFSFTSTQSNVSCFGGSDGTATVSLSDSTVTYLWNTTPLQTTPTATGLTAGTYSVTITDTTITELIINGDFSAGNTGFSTDYLYCNTPGCLGPEGYYAVDTNPNIYNGWTGAGHTTGSPNNFMIINGNPVANQNVWCQTVTVTPGSNYNFSTWISTMDPSAYNPAELQFSINGVNLGSSFTAPLSQNVWWQFSIIWNSGSNTSATICIVNQNIAAGSNDFGLDDISFVGIGQNCDTTYTFIIDQPQLISSTNNLSICDGDSIFIGNNWQSIAGTYYDTLLAVNGCDSIVISNLTINAVSTSTDVITSCTPITWIDGITYPATTNTPTYTIVGGAANGCDSVVTLNLTINSAVTGTDVVVSCTSITWIDGVTYTASTNTPIYTIVGGSSQGCDSIVTLNLTINNTVTSTNVQTACNSFTWIDGITYTASTNTPAFTIVGGASNGCDSVITLNLTIKSSTSGTDVQTACGSYLWIDGNTYTASTNMPTYVLTNAAGCDSVVTLNLTITVPITTTNVFSECEGFSVTVGTNIYTTTGVFTDVINNCDTIITNLTINPAPQLTLIKADDNCGENIGSVEAEVTTPNMPIVYNWSNGSSDSIINNLAAGTYTLIVQDNTGCTTTGQAIINETNIACDFFVYTPNMFSPNGDGENDVFFVRGKGIATLSVKIYNRWGNKVFEINDVNQGWDGTYKGSDQGTAVFVYVLEATFLNGKTVTESGDVSLIR